MMTLSQKIRALRKSANLSQAEFAESVGVTQGQVSRWERLINPETPSADALVKIAKFGKLSVDSLLLIKGRASLAPVVAKIIHGDEMIALPNSDKAVAAPEGAEPATVAAQVETGAFGSPMFGGWYAFFNPSHLPPSTDMLGKLCIVGTADGRQLVKILQAGQVEGRYNLLSVYGPPLYDVEVIWASKVTHLTQA